MLYLTCSSADKKVDHVYNGYRSNDLNNLDFLEQACATYSLAKPFISVLKTISRRRRSCAIVAYLHFCCFEKWRFLGFSDFFKFS